MIVFAYPAKTPAFVIRRVEETAMKNKGECINEKQ
jgi:hypothetical protein